MSSSNFGFLKTHDPVLFELASAGERAALGEPLVPFARRVEGAMEKICALHDWTPVQRKCLDRGTTASTTPIM